MAFWPDDPTNGNSKCVILWHDYINQFLVTKNNAITIWTNFLLAERKPEQRELLKLRMNRDDP